MTSTKRAAPPRPPPEEPPEVVAKRIGASLKTAEDALALFVASLRTGGFARAGPQYEQLHAVLAEQRLWAVTNKRTELDPRWKAIAAQARELHDIMAPLTRAMDGLKDIDRIQPVTVKDVGKDGGSTSGATPAPDKAPPKKRSRKKSE